MARNIAVVLIFAYCLLALTPVSRAQPTTEEEVSAGFLIKFGLKDKEPQRAQRGLRPQPDCGLRIGACQRVAACGGLDCRLTMRD